MNNIINDNDKVLDASRCTLIEIEHFEIGEWIMTIMRTGKICARWTFATVDNYIASSFRLNENEIVWKLNLLLNRNAFSVQATANGVFNYCDIELIRTTILM